MVNQMVHYPTARLDASFAALSDATRRGVLEQLGRSDASISELAEKFHMTLTGMKKHVSRLEEAGLVATEKVGREQTNQQKPQQQTKKTTKKKRGRRTPKPNTKTNPPTARRPSLFRRRGRR